MRSCRTGLGSLTKLPNPLLFEHFNNSMVDWPRRGPMKKKSWFHNKAPVACSQQQLSPGYAFVYWTPVVDNEKRTTAAGGLCYASGEIKLGASGPSVAPVSRLAHHHPQAPGGFYKQTQTRGGANLVESRGMQPGSHFQAFFFCEALYRPSSGSRREFAQ